MAELKDCRRIQLASRSRTSGTLCYLEGNLEIPFAIERIFWIYDLNANERRGGHAYHRQEQFILALAGAFDLILHDGRERIREHLSRPDEGLYLPPGIWREMENPTNGAVALILSSRRFDPADARGDFTAFADGSDVSGV